MEVRIDASDIDSLVNQLVRFGDEGKKQIHRAVIAATTKARTAAIQNVQRGEKSGVIYGNHQASAAGESPATDTGRLVGSIEMDAPRGLIKSKLDYAFWLEFGTQHIAPRPFLRPAALSVRPYLVAQLEKGIERAAGAAGF